MCNYNSMQKFLLFFLLCSGIVHAQNPVPNPGFELWSLGEADEWLSNNSLPDVLTIEPTLDANTGLTAIRGSVVDVAGAIIPPFLGSNGLGGYGFSIQQAYTTFQCWYKTDLQGGDAFIVTVVMYDDSAQVVGYGDIAITTSSNSYSLLSVPINYPFGTDVSSCVIQFIIADTSGGSIAHAASSFIVDDVELTGINGVALTGKESEFLSYPNPATGSLTISSRLLSKPGTRVSVTGQDGKTTTLRNTAFSSPSQQNWKLDTSKLTPGSYILSIRNEDVVLSKRILVIH